MRKRGQIRLRRFILRRILAIVAVVVLPVFVVMGVFLRTFIISDARKQLDTLAARTEELLSSMSDGARTQGGYAEGVIMGGGLLQLRGNVFIYMPGQGVVDDLRGDVIAAFLNAHAELTDRPIDGLRVSGRGSYYVSSVEDSGREGAWVILYVDVTSVMRFYRAVTVALTVILVISALIAAESARRMSGTLAHRVDRLSDYAAGIGKGRFDAERPDSLIAEFQALSETMERMSGELNAARRQQAAFFQNVSHELRTPLMSIRCYAEGIEYGVMDPKSSSGTILEETDKLSGMVENILYISRIDSADVGRITQEYDLRELMSSCAAAQRTIAESQGVAFEFRFDESPVTLECVEEDINRLCDNLVSNALRYARSRIVMECGRTAEGVLLAVSDDGDGIGEDDLPYIFDRFYKGKGGVHGIGLSIVQSVADHYNARIEVKNESGCRFSVTFPSENT